jgi:flagellar basal body rod protein FlgB
MANIDTPGYTAVGMDFEAEMRRGDDDVDQGERGAAGAPEGC